MIKQAIIDENTPNPEPVSKEEQARRFWKGLKKLATDELSTIEAHEEHVSKRLADKVTDTSCKKNTE